MIKRTLLVITLICLISFITGCVGLAISELRGLESVTITNELKDKNPLKVSKQEAKRISILALGFPRTRMVVWEQRFRELQLQIIHNKLSKSDKFRLINFTEFDQAAYRAVPGLYWDPLTDQQQKEALKEIGTQLNADGILIVKEKAVGYAGGGFKGKSIGKALFVGLIDCESTLTFQVVSSKTGETIWLQEEDLIYSTGKLGIKPMDDENVIKMIRPSITPLVDNLLASFEASTTVSSPSTRKPDPTSSENSDGIYLIAIKNSNIRATPTTKSQILTTIKKGTKIEKIGESRDWFKVKLPSGEIGHVFKPLVIELQ